MAVAFRVQPQRIITFSPIIDGLPVYEHIGLSITITNFEDFRELSEREAHDYAHLAMARATWFRLVMRHFAPSPTSETDR